MPPNAGERGVTAVRQEPDGGSFALRLASWLARGAARSADPDADWRGMQEYLAGGERLLAELPAKASRDQAAQVQADGIHAASRAGRSAFLQTHGAWVYGHLTSGATVRLRLNALCERAAVVFPGLVPSVSQLASEARLFQKEKEGREIDQGIFVSALLADPACGTHLTETMLRPSPLALELLPSFAQQGQLQLSRLHLERRGTTAYLTVDHPACLNAEDNQLIVDMETAVDLALLDPQVQVAVLRGAAMRHPKYAGRRVFSAGINLKELHRGQISFVNFLLAREMGYINKILRGVIVDRADGTSAVVEKAWIAAVDTFAIGGGAQLLLVFDHVIAASDSYFSLPAAQEGIVPGAANLRLARSVGTRLAKRIILGGQKVEAAGPDAMLLFDRVVDPDAMDEAIEAAAVLLESPAVIANRRMLTLAEEPLAQFRAYMAEFSHEQARRMYCDDVLNKVARA